RLVGMVAPVPALGKGQGLGRPELTFGANALEEHDELELEGDDRIDTRPAALRGGNADQGADEAQVGLSLEVAVEVVSRHEVLERDGDRTILTTQLDWTKHGSRLILGGRVNHQPSSGRLMRPRVAPSSLSRIRLGGACTADFFNRLACRA